MRSGNAGLFAGDHTENQFAGILPVSAGVHNGKSRNDKDPRSVKRASRDGRIVAGNHDAVFRAKPETDCRNLLKNISSVAKELSDLVFILGCYRRFGRTFCVKNKIRF